MSSKTMRREIWEWAKALLIAFALATLIRTVLLEPYKVDGKSMEPTLHDEERLFLNRLVYRLYSPRRGDVVVVSLPEEGISIIKRVIGVAGDEVAVRDGAVWINGTRLVEPYLGQPTLGRYGPVLVPEGSLIVMGDNRQNSRDSRDPGIGFVSLEQVKGKAMFVYWPLTSFRTIPR